MRDAVVLTDDVHLQLGQRHQGGPQGPGVARGGGSRIDSGRQATPRADGRYEMEEGFRRRCSRPLSPANNVRASE